uniref:AB hydrolase-1 domain-containing protein n=1 Tax=Pavo cristatus TaxID=9049 RepID=A0A8C9G7V8_PAVCR
MQNTGQKPAVLLHHGTFADCTYWIANLPNNSLGFILADAGYDVWLGNSRGNTWSAKHKTLKTCQKEFWQFSFNEIGKYDLPAELYFIMNKTGQKNVYYVGHSEGSTAGFVALSTYPELAQRVKMFFALGPVLTITHATSPFVTFTRLPQPVIKLVLGCKGALHQNELLRRLAIQLCTPLQKVCANILYSIAGGRVQNLNAVSMSKSTLMPVEMSIHSGALPFLQTTPPAYEIEKISTPIAVWSGGQDKFADLKDMAKLLSRITNLCYYKNFPDWGHLDFIWGLDAAEKMYMKIIELLIKYL